MTTRIPQNPLTSISCPIRASSSRAFRVPNVSAEASRKGAEGRSIPTQTFVASSAEARGGTLFNTRDHDRLDEWVRISQTKQETWYDEIKRQSQQWGTILQTKATQARTESSEARRQELETYWQIQEQQLAEHRSRLAEAAERRRIAQEERQRAIEEEALLQRLQLEAEEEHRRWEAEEAAEQRRIAQEEQQRMIEEEARLQRLRLEAEEEHRRREAEAAERRRRERERECAVCLEMNDMGGMIQTPCQHWYCQEHLRGKLEYDCGGFWLTLRSCHGGRINLEEAFSVLPNYCPHDRAPQSLLSRLSSSVQ